MCLIIAVLVMVFGSFPFFYISLFASEGRKLDFSHFEKTIPIKTFKYDKLTRI